MVKCKSILITWLHCTCAALQVKLFAQPPFHNQPLWLRKNCLQIYSSKLLGTMPTKIVAVCRGCCVKLTPITSSFVLCLSLYFSCSVLFMNSYCLCQLLLQLLCTFNSIFWILWGYYLSLKWAFHCEVCEIWGFLVFVLLFVFRLK